MRRRDVLKVLGGAAIGAPWRLTARAQKAMPVIGVLNIGSAATSDQTLEAFREGLRSAGYVENQNVTIAYRFAEGQYDRLAGLAADLVRAQVAVIFASGAGGTSPIAAKAATSTIPIVFTGGIDPVQLGLVASLNRPGGNVTGVTFLANAIEAKRLGLLHELVPQAGTLAALLNPGNASTDVEMRDLEQAAQTLGLRLLFGKASAERDFDGALANMAQNGAGGLVVTTDAFFFQRRKQLVSAVARLRLPAIYHDREIAAAGGLMSYGASLLEGFRGAGIYAARILKGEKPADIPVLQASKFELVINLKTVKSLGLTVAPGLLAIADEVIE